MAESPMSSLLFRVSPGPLPDQVWPQWSWVASAKSLESNPSRVSATRAQGADERGRSGKRVKVVPLGLNHTRNTASGSTTASGKMGVMSGVAPRFTLKSPFSTGKARGFCGSPVLWVCTMPSLFQVYWPRLSTMANLK